MSHDERNALARAELDDLLIRQAATGLDADETRRLNRLLARFPDTDEEWARRVVGEIDAASVGGEAAPLPDELRAALLDSAPEATNSGSVRGAGLLRWSGWLAAAAVAALWWLGPLAPTPTAAPGWDTVVASEEVVVAAWEPGGDATGDDVSGEVAWSGSMQRGVLRLAGLAVNAPDDAQYQLWIFDEARDARYPVDGGVFDIPTGEGVVEIPVEPAIPVDSPTLFAVTVERPGGVVVSDRSRIATLARVGEG